MTRRDEGGGRSINSVVAGFALIRALERRPGMTALKDLAADAGMTPSRAHAYLASFRTVGLVAQEAGGDRYGLGPYALALGLAALGRVEVAEAARDPMRRFVEATGEAVHLAVWSGSAPVIVARLDGRRATPLTIRVGFALPLGSSASGRLFLALRPDAAAALPRPERVVLAAVLRAIRGGGLARTDGMVQNGLAAVSAPVLAHDGSLAAALTTLGPAGVMDLQEGGAVVVALRRAAAEASAAMGHGAVAPPPPPPPPPAPRRRARPTATEGPGGG